MLAQYRRVLLTVVLGVVAGLVVVTCVPDEPNELDKLGTVGLTIKGEPFLLWIADGLGEQERGLMFVTSEQMADLPDGTRRGMLFVYDRELQLSFWMKNTIIPLDIAYLDSDGIVVAIHTMAPLDDRLGHYRSGSPAQYAIEFNANVCAELGLEVGDRIEIPTSSLKGAR